MKNMAFKMWCKAQYVKQHAGDYLKREEGGVDGIIIAIIIIIIVVALAVVFRKQIGVWFNQLVGQVDVTSMGDTGASIVSGS